MTSIRERIEASEHQVFAIIDLLHLKEGEEDLADELDALLFNLTKILAGIRNDL